jgi:hypothetical protein
MRNISHKVIEKIKKRILCSGTFFRKSCRSRENVEKYGRATQATDDNTIWRMRCARWTNKATDTHILIICTLIAFQREQC